MANSLVPTFSNGPRTTMELVAQTAGGNSYADMLAAEYAQGMSSSQEFGPGAPTTPLDGYGRHPRAQDYISGYNIAARPRSQERVSFTTLRALINVYDIAQMCISHRIDSIRSLPWNLVPVTGTVGDAAAQIHRVKSILRKPDGQLFFKSWMSKYLYDVLAFDAGTLYRMRNNAGQAIGLEVVDGTTIAPLLDGYGRRPHGEAPAYVQFVQGVNYNALYDDDIIYQPYRPTSDSPYGKAPLESILLNANTDIRFQQYFLESFTAGNVPEGFAISPEAWGPEQVRDYQKMWDALIYGDDEAKHQIKWLPGGTKLDFPNRKEFKGDFSLFLMQKTMATFHVTPADLGFTHDVNRATGDSQASVQNRVGDVPLVQHLEDILNSFIQDDLGAPLEFQFDLGGEEEDRLATAQSDDLYVKNGTVSPSHIRRLRFGLDEAGGVEIPRFIFTTHEGPIPLSSLLAAAGAVDPETGGPVPGTVVPAQQTAVAAVTASTAAPVAAPTVDAPVPAVPAAVVKADAGSSRTVYSTSEFAAFRKFEKARLEKGVWRDFRFDSVDPVTAHRMNVAGYAAVRKAAGQISVAGLAVHAADTGRVLLIQRALDPTDPASGTWECPGGHLEPGETADAAAMREWCEEVGVAIPAGVWGGTWVSTSGHYAGFVWEIPTEVSIDAGLLGAGLINPDDPDGDVTESVAWWNPADIVGNRVVRAELAADVALLLSALRGPQQPAQPLPEADAVPFQKSWRDTDEVTPQLRYDLPLTDHYSPLISAALLAVLDRIDVAGIVSRFAGKVQKADSDVEAQIRAELGAGLTNADWAALRAQVDKLITDSYPAGQHAAGEQLAGHSITAAGFSPAEANIDWSSWEPGDPSGAAAAEDGGLRALLDAADITIKDIGSSTLDAIGNSIASGLSDGTSAEDIGRSIRDLVGSSARADRIAHTESTRAVIDGTMSVYSASGVTQWDLITSAGACTICLSIEANNPHPVADYSSAPPVHPYCRCSAAPVVATVDSGAIQSTDSTDSTDPSEE
jgi:8-oxo-dGTP pyrophosphatase MutT (NUDIX family)